MKKLTLFLALLLSVSTFASNVTNLDPDPEFDKDGTLSGVVYDKNLQQPLPYVTVVIKDLNGEVITGSITDDYGVFKVVDIPFGKVNVSITFIGYKTYSSEIDLTKKNRKVDMGRIELEEDVEALDEVVVVAENTTIKQKLDRKVITVGKDLITAGPTASDIMNNLPSVNVDQQTGAISLRGNQNVQVMVDGKLSNVPVDQLLKQIPSNAIKQIELITNLKKQQAAPVPRLGGIGVMGAFALTISLAAMLHAFAPQWLSTSWLPGEVPTVWIAIAAAFGFAIIGALDDIWQLGAVSKLLMVVAISIAAPLAGVTVPALETPFGNVDTHALMIAGSALWLLVFVNAANFMDGSNGLSLGSLAIMCAGLGLCLWITGYGYPGGIVCIIAAIAGFLAHNLRGSLYAGDAGAFGVGGLFACLALISGLPVWTIATLALPFLVDVLLTLVSRTRRGEPLFEAHLDHAYQSLIKAGWSHLEVAMVWWALSAACAVAAAVGAVGGGALPFVLFWVLAVLLSAGWVAVRRKL